MENIVAKQVEELNKMIANDAFVDPEDMHDYILEHMPELHEEACRIRKAQFQAETEEAYIELGVELVIE